MTSKHEPRKVTDSKATKRSSGWRNSSRNRSSERNAKEPRLTSNNEEKTQPANEGSTKDVKKIDKIAKPERYNELSPLMTKMVEDELKNVMINIWQALPATTSNAAEKMVLEKLKGVAGDDLRNTIGLNVTNRLINIHNGILVKIIIYSGVTPSELYSFSKKFNIQELKNVQSRTYAGRMTSWADLDALVTRKDLRCGKSRVSVTPIYNFLKCPPSLRTIFDGSQDYSEAKAKEKEIAKTMKKIEGKLVLTADKVLAEDAKRSIARKDSSKTADAKNITDCKISEKTLETKASKDNVNQSIKDKVETKNSKETVTVNKNLKVVPAAKNSEVTTKKVENKPLPSKVQSETKPAVFKNIPAKNILKPDRTPTNKPSELTAVVKKENTTAKSTTIQAKVEPPKVVEKQTQNAVKKETKTETQPIKVEATKTIANKQAVATNVSKVTENNPKVLNTPAKVAAPKVATTPKLATTTKVATTPKGATTPKLATITKVATTPNKNLEAPTSIEKKPDVKTSQVEPTKAPIKEPTKSDTKPATPNLAKKENVPKLSESKKPDIQAAKIEPKPTAKVNKPNITPKKEIKLKPAEIVKPNMKVVKMTKSKKNESDFDELSDRDILAMLSGGIVLDECSGSEED